jgi:hypothetical protein
MADDILKFRAGDLRATVLEQAAERDISVSQWLREASEAFAAQHTGCDSCQSCTICGSEVLELDPMDEGATATIMGYGRFSETDNPDVQALIDRAKELLAEGAVGVSVSLDLDPDELPADINDADPETLDEVHQRVRHLAIVDTAAFSGAFVDHATDGTLAGPLVFEGIPTGDLRTVGPVGSINLESSPLPIPLLFDLEEGDHTGTVVGYIDRLERVDGIVGAGTAPLAASTSAYPAYLFSEPEPTAMTVHAPDSKGYRRYTGLIAPSGVCHKGMGGCYTYKQASLDYFHSGARIPLDDGSFTRVGPLMFGDMHADSSKMDYATALERTNEDARTVFAMGRCYHHPKGLLFSGVLMEDADIMRVQATAPSVEIWPDNRGKPELKTALQVPRPAFPVAASLTGGGIQLTESEPVQVEEAHGEHHERLVELASRLERLENDVAPMLAAHMAANL